MLRFFRKYNTFILVVGGCLLMASFLVQDVVQNFANEQVDDVIGQLDGEEIRQSDIVNASGEMQMLGRLSPMLQVSPNMEALQWILMLKEAQAMGLSASKQEANAIRTAAGMTDETLATVSAASKLTVDETLEVVRRWAIVQQYESTILGVPYVSVVSRLTQAREIAERSASFQQQPINWRLASLYYMSMGGRPVLSEPLVQRSMYDQRSNARIVAIEYPSSRYLDTEKITSPSETVKRALFDKYKDSFKGESEPYGFGYKTPDQAKLEYLYISFADARAKIKADQEIMLDLEAEAASEYEKNKFRYLIPEAPPVPPVVPPVDDKPGDKATDTKPADTKPADKKPATKDKAGEASGCQPDDAVADTKAKPVAAPEKTAADKPAKPNAADDKEKPVVKPPVVKPVPTVPAAPPAPKFQSYEDVRKDIIDRLVQKRGRDLVAKMARQANSLLRNNTKALVTDDDGYIDTDVDTWVPLKLETVAQQLQKEFGILPSVTREDKGWLDKPAVSALLNFGGATLTFQNRTITAADYVFAMRTFLAEDEASPLITLHPQKLIASLPLTNITGQFVFRVLDARSAGAPDYETVKDEVDRNARQQKAYEVLKSKMAEWEKRAKGEKMEDLAKELNLKLLEPVAFKKRETDMDGRGLTVPNIRPIGKNAVLVDAVFGLLETHAASGSIDKVPTAHRSGAVLNDKKLSAVFFRIDEYKPMTKADFETAKSQGSATSQAFAALRNPDEEPVNPISLDSIIERTGFEYEESDEDEDEDEDSGDEDVASNE